MIARRQEEISHTWPQCDVNSRQWNEWLVGKCFCHVPVEEKSDLAIYAKVHDFWKDKKTGSIVGRTTIIAEDADHCFVQVRHEVRPLKDFDPNNYRVIPERFFNNQAKNCIIALARSNRVNIKNDRTDCHIACEKCGVICRCIGWQGQWRCAFCLEQSSIIDDEILDFLKDSHGEYDGELWSDLVEQFRENEDDREYE